MQVVSLHFEAGSDLHHTLQALALDQGASGFVLSVVGNLSQAAFQCPGQTHPTVVHGDLEIISLQGTLAPDRVHLHLSLSDGSCQVWGGHLEPGTLVQTGADLLVGWLAGPEQTDAASAQSGSDRSLSEADPEEGYRLEIVVHPDCPWSRRSLRMLHSLAIPHRVVEAQQPGPVPQVFLDGEGIGGYEALVDLHASGALVKLREG